MEKGIKESMNEKGQSVVDVELFEDNWNRSNNGKYVFDRVRFSHRKVILKYMSLSSQGTEKWQDIAREIAKNRKISVRDVAELLKNDGLTEEEQKMFEQTTKSGSQKIDIEKMYDMAPEFLQAFVVESPIPMKTSDDIENMDFSLGRILFERCVVWAIKGFQVDQERRKK